MKTDITGFSFVKSRWQTVRESARMSVGTAEVFWNKAHLIFWQRESGHVEDQELLGLKI